MKRRDSQNINHYLQQIILTLLLWNPLPTIIQDYSFRARTNHCETIVHKLDTLATPLLHNIGHDNEHM